MSVSRPVTSQTTSNQPGAPTCRAMIDETIKIPEPIIDPATSMVESSKPSPRTNFCSVAAGVVVVVVSIKGLYLVAARVPSRNLRNFGKWPKARDSQQSLGTRDLRTVLAGSPKQAVASLPGLIRCPVRALAFAYERLRPRFEFCHRGRFSSAPLQSKQRASKHQRY